MERGRRRRLTPKEEEIRDRLNRRAVIAMRVALDGLIQIRDQMKEVTYDHDEILAIAERHTASLALTLFARKALLSPLGITDVTHLTSQQMELKLDELIEEAKASDELEPDEIVSVLELALISLKGEVQADEEGRYQGADQDDKDD